MFTQKLQNPFLKPTPFFSTNNYTSYSYAPPLPPTSKHSAYPPYENQKYSRYDSYSNNNQKMSEVNQPPRYKQSADINDILRNNPFNKPTNPIFASSSANSYSPAKYETNRNNHKSRQISYERKEPNEGYSNPRYAGYDGMANQYSQNRLTPKKHDNYLSTSSAESAVTYINKIYQLDEQKSEGFGALNNPFFRKNLIEQKKAYERQNKYANSYDNATMKYIAGQKQYQKPPYLENNYLFSNKQQYPAYQSKTKSKEYIPQGRDYSDLEYKKDSYGSKKEINQQSSYKGYDDSKTSSYRNYEKQKDYYQNGQSNYGSKKHIESKYDDKYESYKYESKQDKYDKYEQNYTLPKDNFGSKKNIEHDQYNQNQKYYREYEDKYNNLEKSDSKFDFQQSQHKQSKKYNDERARDEYLHKDKYEFQRNPRDQEAQCNYKYSFKGQSNNYSHKDVPKQNKKSQQRINFPQTESSYESSKCRQKEYTGAFQTLGGVASNKYKEDTYNIASKKLISSQVQQYETHQAKNKSKEIIKPIEHQNPRDKKYGTYEQQQEEDYGYQQRSKKGPVRDVQENYPAVVYYNGMVFSRVEVK